MNKKMYIGVTIIILLMLAFICAFIFGKEIGKTNETASNNVNEKKINEVVNEKINDISNIVVDDTLTNEVENTGTLQTTGITQQNTQSTNDKNLETEEEKVISIVRRDWNGTNVDFSIQGMDNNGNFIVQVTNSDTQVLAFYTVNPSDGSFTKKDMS